MSTGLLLFLIFMALSIIDSVARARRSQQQEQALPPEDEGDEEWRAEPSSAQAGEGETRETREKEPAEALGELVGLEKLMGPGYLEKLMGPGITAVIQDEEDIPEEPSEAPPARSDERRRPSLDRDERRTIARERRSSDQERRRREAERRARVDRAPPERDRRLSKRDESRGRPARAPREAVPLRDSAAGERRRLERAAAAPGTGRGERPRTRIYRELFGSGDRDSLRRAFVLKEILDAPSSERPPDRRETG